LARQVSYESLPPALAEATKGTESDSAKNLGHQEPQAAVASSENLMRSSGFKARRAHRRADQAGTDGIAQTAVEVLGVETWRPSPYRPTTANMPKGGSATQKGNQSPRTSLTMCRPASQIPRRAQERGAAGSSCCRRGQSPGERTWGGGGCRRQSEGLEWSSQPSRRASRTTADSGSRPQAEPAAGGVSGRSGWRIQTVSVQVQELGCH